MCQEVHMLRFANHAMPTPNWQRYYAVDGRSAGSFASALDGPTSAPICVRVLALIDLLSEQVRVAILGWS